MPSLKRFVLPALSLATTACVVASLGAAAPSSAGQTTPAPPTALADGQRAPGTGTAEHPKHSSDGIAGWVAQDLPAGRRKVTIANEVSWDMAPGINFRQWDQIDGRQPVGQIRAQLLTIDINNPANELDLVAPAKVPVRKPVSELAAKAGAVAAVNGDFFDIGDTGAPLGVGKDRELGMRHAPKAGWNNSFYVGADGHPYIGPLPYKGKLKQHPKLKFSNHNSPSIQANGIGVFDKNWGPTQGSSVTAGQKRVREVVVVGGRVRSNKTKVSEGLRIRGKGLVFVARGMATKMLKKVKVGEKATVVESLASSPTMAISGDRPLLTNGSRVVINDVLAHPRTAIGIDADGGKVLILVIDGRQSFSRGYTMVELANMMAALGAENALNLDGGGSSTMVGHTPTGQLAVLNSPSDGHERLVPNGIGVFSRPVS
ncbi:phosphodiester glycosidase family protein [Nocardioides sp. LHG3406-4]|uniref:phosphodiester glycosidase family protein n=1 Tax=Nocardioides sp. LHG3406-4 TaxID=2804575 RepID=UPI003CEE5887